MTLKIIGIIFLSVMFLIALKNIYKGYNKDSKKSVNNIKNMTGNHLSDEEEKNAYLEYGEAGSFHEDCGDRD